jgi:GT2 family glycosyltransferase
MVDLSLVLVGFRSSGVAGEAVASFRAEVSRIGARGEVIVVDHSQDAEELERLQQVRPDKLLVQENRGYAAGVNAGLAHASGATMLVGNPDVRFTEGSLGPLLAALAAGWDVVGPQFVLGGLLFAPADVQTPAEELRRWLASRSRLLWRLHFGRELRRWRRAWDASAPLAVPALSGALLAFRREAVARIGPWDERYFLYFEETDWLWRALSAGMRVALVPAARVEHVWGHAADPDTQGEHFMASRRRFLAGKFGRRGRLAARLRVTRTPLRPRPFPDAPEALPQGRLLWLLSPTALGFPAAGLEGEAPALARALDVVAAERGRPARYLVLGVRPGTGSVVGTWSVEQGRG